MKKIVILLGVFFMAVILIFLYKNDSGKVSDEKEQIVNWFEIPCKNIPAGYPIEIINYREVKGKSGELMIFGRTVWSKKIKGDIGGKPAFVPVEIFVKNDGDKRLITRGYSSSKDGHIVFVIKEPEKKYLLKIDYENAVGCPEEFKNGDKREINNISVINITD